MTEIQEVNTAMELFTQGKHSEAEKQLITLSKKYSNDPIITLINYYLGIIYNFYLGDVGDKEKAKEYFGYVVEAENSIEEAFVELANLEKNKNHKKRVLRKGLEKFPNGNKIYESLISSSSNEERMEIFKEIDEKGISSDYILAAKAITYFEVGEFEITIKTINKMLSSTSYNKALLKLILGYAYYEAGKTQPAKRIFKKLSDDDIKHRLNFIPYFGNILCDLTLGENKSAFHILQDIEEDTDGDYLLIDSNPLIYDFEKYFLKFIEKIKKNTRKKEVLAKVKGLESIHKMRDGYLNSNKEYEKTIADLKNALQYSSSIKLFECLYDAYVGKGDLWEAFEIAWVYIQKSSEKDIEYRDFDFIEKANDSTFSKIISGFKKNIQKEVFDTSKKKYAKTLLVAIIQRLMNEKRFEEIIEISNCFLRKQLEGSSILFEIAYAHNELKNLEEAEVFYNLYLEDNHESSAAYNNLGLIHEGKGLLDKSKECFQIALKFDEKDETARRNLKRVEERIKNNAEENRNLSKALEEFKIENGYIKSKMQCFSEKRGENGLIMCPWKQLPQCFCAKPEKAEELRDIFLRKKYITQVSSNPISVYRINPFIDDYLIKVQKEIKEEKPLLDIGEKINFSELNSRGYTESLISQLETVVSEELKDILKRDLKECVLALITESYKSVFILSGSIIEALLLDRIIGKGILIYKIEKGQQTKSRKVSEMTMDELLLVAKSENIIRDQSFHLSHALRIYRNLIHPAVEQRKISANIDQEQAQLAWDILKNLIKVL